jgi:LmbE family N-acetylglucosaminyl deacetylase
MATLLVLALPSSWNNDNGTHPPIFVDYRDHERSTAACATLTHDVWRVMVAVQPAVVLTCGPTGLSGHEDHPTRHHVTTAAFHRSRPTAVMAPRLYDSPCHPRVPRQPVVAASPAVRA